MLLVYISYIVLLLSVTNVSADMFLWNSVDVGNSTNTVAHQAVYQFTDTSANNVGRNKAINVSLNYEVEALPFPLTFGSVDWCNLTVTHEINIFDSLGNIINTSTSKTSIFFQNNSFTSGYVSNNMFDKDSLIAEMRCHYTDQRSLFQDSVLIGRFTTYMPSFECADCTDKSLEQLSNATQTTQDSANKELQIYSFFQSLIDFIYKIWLYGSWIIKILLLFVGVGLIFAGAFWFYHFVSDLVRKVR